MAPSHVRGAENLSFPKNRADRSRADFRQNQVEQAHHQESDEKAENGRRDHRNDDFVEDPRVFVPGSTCGDFRPDERAPVVVTGGERRADESTDEGMG